MDKSKYVNGGCTTGWNMLRAHKTATDAMERAGIDWRSDRVPPGTKEFSVGFDGGLLRFRISLPNGMMIDMHVEETSVVIIHEPIKK